MQEGAWGAPEDDEPDYDPTEWVDKSVTGFGKADTSWLTEEVPELAQEMDERAKKKAEEDVSPKSNQSTFVFAPVCLSHSSTPLLRADGHALCAHKARPSACLPSDHIERACCAGKCLGHGISAVVLRCMSVTL